MQGQSLAESEDYVKAVYYGDPKQGKTSAMAGAARLGPMVAIDIEGRGWLASSLRKRGIPIENITIFRAQTFNELEQAYWEIMGMIHDGVPLVACAIDHMSELEAILLQAERERRVGKAERTIREGNGDKKIRDALIEELNPFNSEIQDYGVWTNQGRKLMRMYRDLPMNVAFAAHVRTDKGQRVPDLTEKFRNMLTGGMNMVIGTTTLQVPGESDVEYVGYMRSISKWSGGDLFEVTPPCVANPSFDRLILAARGELDFATDEKQQDLKRRMSK